MKVHIFSLLAIAALFAIMTSCKTSREAQSLGKVIDGYTAVKNHFPSTVAIHNCTAVKISDSHLLTAAHCLYDPMTKDPLELYANEQTLAIGAGISDETPNSFAYEGQFKIKESLVHHSYATALSNSVGTEIKREVMLKAVDLAVLKLDTPIPGVPNASMELAKPEVEKTKIVLNGFGCQQDASNSIGIPEGSAIGLTEVEQRQRFRPMSYGFTNYSYSKGPIHFASLDIFNQEKSCSGDSGGPVYLDDRDTTTDKIEKSSTWKATKFIGIISASNLVSTAFSRLDHHNGISLGECLNTYTQSGKMPSECGFKPLFAYTPKQ